jgi:hypothetical protein
MHEDVMAQPQSFKNHARFFPPFHFVVMPLLLANVIVAIMATVHHWPHGHLLFLWWIVMSIALILLAFSSRAMALKAQDRTIRLEEQLRLADLLPESQLDLIEKLSLRQFIGLRFASDAEAPALAARAVAEGLTEKQIKQSIVNWKADDYRV